MAAREQLTRGTWWKYTPVNEGRRGVRGDKRKRGVEDDSRREGEDKEIRGDREIWENMKIVQEGSKEKVASAYSSSTVGVFR